MASILDFIPFAKQVTAHEYAAPCPECMGTDRFRIWPEKGKGGSYWCRQCGIKDDGIAYLRNFHGMSFQEACKALELNSPHHQKVVPKNQQGQSAQWRKSAHAFLVAMPEKCTSSCVAKATFKRRNVLHLRHWLQRTRPISAPFSVGVT